MLKKNISFYAICLICVLGCAGLALAKKPKQIVNVNPSKGHAIVKIPARAIEVAPGIFSLGQTMHNGEMVEGYAVFKYKENAVKVCGNGICEPGENARKCPIDCGGTPVPDPEPDTSSCYEYLSKGAKWKTTEPYIVNPANNEGLNESFILDNLAYDIEKWENAAGVNIFGQGTSASTTLEADLMSPDDLNEVYFGSIEDPGAIAITIIWGIFGGPPKNRKLIEWDQVYDEVDFDWSDSGEADKMDFESIATHELGHSAGLGDIYTNECSDVTMYGYADNGETKKQTLEDGDIIGIGRLY